MTMTATERLLSELDERVQEWLDSEFAFDPDDDTEGEQ